MRSSKYPYKPLPELELPHGYMHRPLFLKVEGEGEPAAIAREDCLFFNIKEDTQTLEHATKLQESNETDRGGRRRTAASSKTLTSRPTRSSVLREKTTLLKQLKDLDQELEHEETRELEEGMPPPLEKIKRQKEVELPTDVVMGAKPTKAALLLKQRNEERAREFAAKRQKEEENEPYVRPRASDLWKKEVPLSEVNRANRLLRAYIKERELERQMEREKDQRACDLILYPQRKKKRSSKDTHEMSETTPSTSDAIHPVSIELRQHELPFQKEQSSAVVTSPILSPPREGEGIQTDNPMLKNDKLTPNRGTAVLRESQIIMSPEPLPSPIAHDDALALGSRVSPASTSSSSSKSGSSSVHFCVERPKNKANNDWENASPCSSTLMTALQEEARHVSPVAITVTDSRLELISPMEVASGDEGHDTDIDRVEQVSQTGHIPYTSMDYKILRMDVIPEETVATPPPAQDRSSSKASLTTIDSISSQETQPTPYRYTSSAPVDAASLPPSTMREAHTSDAATSVSLPRAQTDATNDGGVEQKRRLRALRQSVNAHGSDQAPLSPDTSFSAVAGVKLLPTGRTIDPILATVMEPNLEELPAALNDAQRLFSGVSPKKPRLAPTERRLSLEAERPSPPPAIASAAPRMSQTSAEPNLNLSVPRLSGDAAASPPSPSSTSATFGQPPTTRGNPDGPAAAPSASAQVERPAHLTKASQHAGEVPGIQESAAGKESSTKPHKSATLVPRLTSPSVDCSEISRESIMVSPEERKSTKKKLSFHVELSSQNDSRSLQTKASSVLARSHKTSVLTGCKDSTSSTMVQQTSPPQATSASCLPPPPPPHYAIPYAKAAEETTLTDSTSSVSSIEYWRRKLERTRLDITYELAMESAVTSPDRVDKRVDTLPSIILQGQDAEEAPLSTSSDEAPLRMSPDEDYHLAGSEPQVQQFELTAEQTLDSDMDSVEYERGLQEHAPTPLKASFASPASAKLQSYKEKLAEVDNVAIQKELMLVSSSSSTTGPETPRSEARQDKDRVPSPPHLKETQEDLPRPAAPAKRLPQRKGLRKPDAQSEPARSAQLLKDLEASPPPRSPPVDVSAVSISPPRPGTPVPFLADHTPSPSSELMMFPTPSMSPEQAPFYPNFSTDERPSVDAAGSMEADEVRAAFRESPSAENREEYVHTVQIVYGDL